MYILESKPENWDYRDKARARWFHYGLIGSTVMGRRCAHAVSCSPTTTQHQKDLATLIIKLSEELEQALRAERINC